MAAKVLFLIVSSEWLVVSKKHKALPENKKGIPGLVIRITNQL